MRDGWRETTLGDVARTVSPSSNCAGFRYVGLEHFDSGSPSLTRWGSTADVTSATTVFRPGDVLFSKLRPYLRKVAVADFGGRCTSEVLVYRPSIPDLDAGYLGLVLQSEAAIAHAQASSAGSRMPRTSVQLMSSMKVTLPPLDEQRRIVNLSAAVESLIAAVTAQAHEVDRLLCATRDAAPAGQPRRVGDVLSGIANGLTTTSEEQSAGTGTQHFVKASAIWKGDFDEAEIKMAPDSQYAEGYYIRPGQILMTRINTPERVGQLALVRRVRGRLLRPDLVWRLDCKDVVHPGFFVHAMSGSAGRALMSSAASGTSRSMQQISKARLQALPFQLPAMEDQVEYVERCDAIAAVAQGLERQRNRAELLRSNLLTLLLSGAHEIPDSYDELLAG